MKIDGLFRRSINRILKIVVIAGMIMLGFGSEVFAEGKAKACELVRVADLPMKPNNQGLILINAIFNGKPAEFALDTGAFWGIIREHAAVGLQLKKAPISSVGAGGGEMNTYVTVPSYQLGALKIPNPDFFVGPDLLGEDTHRVGNIGIQNLKHFDLEIDPGRGRVRLFVQNKCDLPPIYWRQTDVVKIPFEFSGNHIILPVTLDGKSLRAMLDTGATKSILALKVAEEEFGIVPKSQGVEASLDSATLDGAVLKTYRRQFGVLDIGGVQFRNTWLTLAEDKAKSFFSHGFGHHYISLVLGMHQLRNLHMYIDFKQQVIYVSTVQGDTKAEIVQGNVNYSPSDFVKTSLDFETAEPYIEKAQASLRAGHYSLALEQINKAIQYLPDSEDVYLYRGEIYSQLKDYASALADFGKALQINPVSIDARFWRAQIYSRMGRDSDAISDMSEMLSTDPKNSAALGVRCWLFARQGKVEQAIADCTASIAVSPDDSAVWGTRARLWFDKGDYDQAIKDFSQVLRLESANADALYARGVAREKMGERKMGMEDKQAALQLDAGVKSRFLEEKNRR